MLTVLLFGLIVQSKSEIINGGSESCSGTENCEILCSKGACQSVTLVCPPNYECIVTCGGSNSCNAVTIKAFDSSRLEIKDCIGNVNTCANMIVEWPSNNGYLTANDFGSGSQFYSVNGWRSINTTLYTGNTFGGSMNCIDFNAPNICTISSTSWQCNTPHICNNPPLLSSTTLQPSIVPTTYSPTIHPNTHQPTIYQSTTTNEPTTYQPTTYQPTSTSTIIPTTYYPTTLQPTSQPTSPTSTISTTTSVPSALPTSSTPTNGPTDNPSSYSPTYNPTLIPSASSLSPTYAPSTSNPSTYSPTSIPTTIPTSSKPTERPSRTLSSTSVILSEEQVTISTLSSTYLAVSTETETFVSSSYNNSSIWISVVTSIGVCAFIIVIFCIYKHYRQNKLENEVDDFNNKKQAVSHTLPDMDEIVHVIDTASPISPSDVNNKLDTFNQYNYNQELPEGSSTGDHTKTDTIQGEFDATFDVVLPSNAINGLDEEFEDLDDDGSDSSYNTDTRDFCD